MKFLIPKHCYIRWQAALAVLEDLQEDVSAPFTMNRWADEETLWEKTNGCGAAACFAGYISVSPYCKALGYPKNDNGKSAVNWLIPVNHYFGWWENPLFRALFSDRLTKGSRAKTLAFLKRRIKKIFKDSTGKRLVAPLTFYV